MSKFEIGDKVRCIDISPEVYGTIKSKKDSFGDYAVELDIPRYYHSCLGKTKEGYGYWGLEKDLQKVEDKMSKYDELKNKIESLENGWDKDADDVKNEICGKYKTKILIDDYDRKIIIQGAGSAAFWGGQDIEFAFSSQCSKMDAFKKALMWLLDHSNIKKGLSEEKRRDLQRQMDKLRVQMETIQKELEG